MHRVGVVGRVGNCFTLLMDRIGEFSNFNNNRTRPANVNKNVFRVSAATGKGETDWTGLLQRRLP